MFSSVDQTLTKHKQYEEALARYETAIRSSIRGTSAIHQKRDTKDVFTNNFNAKLMMITKANHDIQLCTDPYATAHCTV